ncbi:MAG: SpoIIE family protein phosphatase [Clostridia bacterium]|nr:SpoIIE family protein phosphatase [Clostridia bacterium]
MPLKINVKSVLMYALYALAMVFANCALNGVPLSLGLMVSMLLCGTNIIVTPVLFALASIVNLNLILSLLSLFQAAFFGIIVFLYRRFQRKIRFEVLIYAVIALAPYVVFAPWLGANELIITNEYALRGIAAGVILIFGFFCFKSVYSLLFRVQRCRLKEDELVCLSVTFAVCGAGMYSLIGKAFYYCFAAFVIVIAARLTRSPASLIVALLLALPPAMSGLDLKPLTVLIIISTAALLFSGAGRFAAGTVTGLCMAAFMYFDKCFNCAVPLIVVYALLLFLACVLPSIPKSERYANLKRRLLVKEVLPETAVVRSRRQTGEKLYRISEVFREIECAFLALDENVNDEAARAGMLADLKEKCCKNCERQKRCMHTNVYYGFKKLIDAGAVKGKVNLIDLPSEMTVNCSRPADVLATLNGMLAEYRRYMTETENARSGRKLLAEQARGVAEVMKGCAVELSARRDSFSEAAESVKKALSSRGISCPEIYIDGENGNRLSAVILGKPNVKIMSKVISDTLKRKYVLKDKLDFDGEKSCLIFGAPPRLDAAFGVAYAIKSGEKVSGDTHSVIRISDHSFLMALSDGMGSGEYAHKVSEAAISLIEAFYRAEMPEDNVLNTINKLLSFNRDERFTCIDIAAVNLDTGRADFVKIGSPAGIIMREGEIKILESASLPLGILENLRPTVCTERLNPGDIVVFMSDGITSAFSSATDLYEFLQGMKPLNPQSLADKILAGALDKAGHVVTDDMTVLCTRIFDN